MTLIGKEHLPTRDGLLVVSTIFQFDIMILNVLCQSFVYRSLDGVALFFFFSNNLKMTIAF